jgi:tetratricopeptide (TPR) repeat protein
VALTLSLRTDSNGLLTPFLDGHPFAPPTPLNRLPSLKELRADPLNVGKQLLTALGDKALLDRLDADPEGLLLLDTDEPSESIAWEFAALPDHQFFVAQYGLLRLIDRPAPPAPAGNELHFVALAADPLVDEHGKPREGYRLRLDDELRAIRRTLNDSGVALRARRVPPTQAELRRALNRGPAILHLTCHGDVIDTPAGRMAVLFLEDQNGGEDTLLGRDLAVMPPRGVLRLVLLSACHTAETGAGHRTEAHIARSLVGQGVPFAIGMQDAYPDDLSDEIAVGLYENVLAGHPLSESLRLARQSLLQYPDAVGLPVGYTAREGWGAIPLTSGRSDVGGLGYPGKVALTGEVQPPRPLLGRNGELHALAELYSDGHKVVTVAGTGGMGKTALAASFVERFGWRWPDGVLTISFASDVVDAAVFRRTLLGLLEGEAAAQQKAEASIDTQVRDILRALRDWDGLLLLDNYESVLQGLADKSKEAETTHHLVAQIAEGGASLLLTSRERPAGLRGETLFPKTDEPLSGLSLPAAAALFLQNSTKAKDLSDAHLELAAKAADATAGHPLAIALLAGEYDVSAVAPADFLANWENELGTAERRGLMGHHRTFAAAFERSYNRLPEEEQKRLRALSVFPFPFFAQGAAAVWSISNLQSPISNSDLAAAREGLDYFVRRSLLEVEGYFDDKTPAAYRFQPALRQEVARRVLDDERPAQTAGYAAYGAWLAKRGYGDIHKDVGLNRLVRLSMSALETATETLSGTERLWHVRQLAWLKQAFGENQMAYNLLTEALPEGGPLPDPAADREAAAVNSSLRYELAGLLVTRGDLDRALALYQESLQLKEQLGDKKGKAASLANMAQVFLTRGDLDRALALYQESLQLDEQLGDKQGKAASLHAMAQVFLTRGDLDRALALYQESLQLLEQLGDKKGKAASLHQMAQVFLTRGDLDRALALYQESLQLKEQLGDKQGKAASLAGLANIHMRRNEWEKAEAVVSESLALNQQLGEPLGVAFNTVYLGQITQARGDREGALTRYREGLAIFERLGMPRETAQVREMIASLEGGGTTAPDPIQQALAQARAAAERRDFEAAITAQEGAVALMRQQGEGREALAALSVLLFNLAGYYAQVDRHADAVRALEEVVALDERTGHPDLESDRQALEGARRVAALSPEERARLQAAEAEAQELARHLVSLPPEERAKLEAAAREFAALSPSEQAATIARMQRGQIEALAAEIETVALAVESGELPRDKVVSKMEGEAAKAEGAGEPGAELAQFIRAVIAILTEEPVPPVPAAYAGRLATIQAARRSDPKGLRDP